MIQIQARHRCAACRRGAVDLARFDIDLEEVGVADTQVTLTAFANRL